MASAIGLIFVSFFLEQAVPCVPLPRSAEMAIAAFAKFQLATEDCHVRKVARGDVDGDVSADLAIAFNADGSCLGVPVRKVSG
jgi:hypothetical protein